ncbi:hypothetical protein SDC9_126974 [bioreactor metagenome]|uniref:Uncharacterized protein n=1 Tax=bioreactor metagenome TaxID=1076179 RepID=A0A645CSR1_9ZZZZ
MNEDALLIVLRNLRQERKIRVDHNRIEEIEPIEEDEQPDEPCQFSLRHLLGQPYHQEANDHRQCAKQHERKPAPHSLAADVVAPVGNQRVGNAVHNAANQRSRANQRAREYGISGVARHKQQQPRRNKLAEHARAEVPNRVGNLLSALQFAVGSVG